jgi:hypothetical protein
LNHPEEAVSKKLVIVGLALALLGVGIAVAQKPVQDINPQHHPNLAAAQHHADQAYNKIVEAQQANEWDMQGHAKKAKELLEQVNQELKLAAESANKNRK